MNKLYHVVNDNINIKDQFIDVIKYDTKFDNKFRLSSGPPMYSFPVVTFILGGVKKKRQKYFTA